MFIASIEKDKEGYYIHIDKEFTDMAGVAEYNPDMKWERMELAKGMGLSESHQDYLLELEHKVLSKHQPISSSVRAATSSGWMEALTHRTPLRGGGFRSKSYVVSPSSHYNGWPLLLNKRLEVLELPNGHHLTRTDLLVLNMFVQGLPRKVIADGTHSSVKSVEKRLAKIKDKLTPEGQRAHGLAQLLVRHRLMPFLMATNDWFAFETEFTQHVAHTT